MEDFKKALAKSKKRFMNVKHPGITKRLDAEYGASSKDFSGGGVGEIKIGDISRSLDDDQRKARGEHILSTPQESINDSLGKSMKPKLYRKIKSKATEYSKSEGKKNMKKILLLNKVFNRNI